VEAAAAVVDEVEACTDADERRKAWLRAMEPTRAGV
jgi:hypothetical protein